MKNHETAPQFVPESLPEATPNPFLEAVANGHKRIFDAEVGAVDIQAERYAIAVNYKNHDLEGEHEVKTAESIREDIDNSDDPQHTIDSLDSELAQYDLEEFIRNGWIQDKEASEAQKAKPEIGKMDETEAMESLDATNRDSLELKFSSKEFAESRLQATQLEQRLANLDAKKPGTDPEQNDQLYTKLSNEAKLWEKVVGGEDLTLVDHMRVNKLAKELKDAYSDKSEEGEPKKEPTRPSS